MHEPESARITFENAKRTDFLKKKPAGLKNFRQKFDGPTCDEFVLECPGPAREIRDRLIEDDILAGLPLGGWHPELENSLLICATELTSPEDMDRLADALNNA